MFKPTPQVSIQFILDRPSIDIPPPGWTAASAYRTLSGILRVSVPQRAGPLKADRIQIDLYGLINGVRDSVRLLENLAKSTTTTTPTTSTSTHQNSSSLIVNPLDIPHFVNGLGGGGVGDTSLSLLLDNESGSSGGNNGGRGGSGGKRSQNNIPSGSVSESLYNGSSGISGEMMVDRSLIVWQPQDAEENEVGIMPGIHDFPFSIPIPMHILPTYSTRVLTSQNTSSINVNPSPSHLFPRAETRSYELTATIVRRGTSRSLFAKCPVIVRQCFPRWQIAEIPNRIGRGATAEGEFIVKLTIPRLCFLEDKAAEISICISNGTRSVDDITAVKVILTETASYK
ncbi:hypothetical protein HDU76_009125 [Blyttiomyces sp. JEL0837]|nr:hypothetical protein HDU76_009125 [Blyttiomyces sp. JEL0837]